MTYKTLVNDICSNDATIEAIAVALTVYGWAKSTYAAGKAARAWWETDDVIAPLLRLLGEVIWLAMVLAWSYFASGKAQAHWEFINTVVDDGVGLYGPSPMGNAVVRWVRRLVSAIAQTSFYVLNRVGYAVAVRYGRTAAHVTQTMPRAMLSILEHGFQGRVQRQGLVRE